MGSRVSGFWAVAPTPSGMVLAFMGASDFGFGVEGLGRFGLPGPLWIPL